MPISREKAEERAERLSREEERALYARAATARRLIERAQVSPSDGLYYVLFPTQAMLEAEEAAGSAVLYSRGYRGGQI